MSLLLRASNFCRPSPTRVDAKLELIHAGCVGVDGEQPSSAGNPCSEARVTLDVLRTLCIFSGSLVWIEYDKRRIAVRLQVLEDEASNSDTDQPAGRRPERAIQSSVYVSHITAANFGLYGDRAHAISVVLSIVEQAACEADSVSLLTCGRPLPQSWRAWNETSIYATESWPLPPVETILQTSFLISVHENEQLYFYQIAEIDGNATSDNVFVCGNSTKFTLVSPLPSISCRHLPDLNATSRLYKPALSELPPHQDTGRLVAALTLSPSAHMEERVCHVVGTDANHDVCLAMEAAALCLGRRILHIHGLAGHAYASGRNISNGSLADQLSGLEVAIAQAYAHAPCVLHLVRLDQEWATNDHELLCDTQNRVWSVLMDCLRVSDNNAASNGSLWNERSISIPSVLVVISTARLLQPGPMLQNLVYPSIQLRLPNLLYVEHLWQRTTIDATIPSDELLSICKQLEGRPVHEICLLQKQYLETDRDSTGDNSMQLLESLCARLDQSRRQRSGGPKIPSVQWEDVGGLEHVRREILDAIEFPLKYPHLFLGSSTGRSGILLYGPPGTGKTLVAKAVATECQLPFLSIKGPELLGSFVGESEGHVRGIFAQALRLASQNTPKTACILFFDELDSLAPRRGDTASGGNVMDRVVATLLTELDRRHEFTETVFCMGATNRPDLLDPALLRPGRLDRLVYLGVSKSSQTGILMAQIRKLRLQGDAAQFATKIAAVLPDNLTGADLSTISSGALSRATLRLCDQADAELAVLRESNLSAVLDDVLESWDERQLEPTVTLSDLLEAAESVVPSVRPDELERYEKLRDQFQMS
jgi:ATP-dependent 26S proteasome regulatory subunit